MAIAGGPQQAYSRIAGLLFVACLALSGCGASTASATATGATATVMPTATATTATVAPALTPPALIAPGSSTAYTNSAYQYSLRYPANWQTNGTDPTAMAFDLYNYDDASWTQPAFAPGMVKIEVDAAPNSSALSPDAYFQQSLSGPGQAPVTVITHNSATIGGRAAVEYLTQTAGAISITYVVPDGSAMLLISQTTAASQQPSGTFTALLASFTFTA